MPVEDVVSRKTRKGAENWITNLVPAVGEWVEDSRWDGGKSVDVLIRFTVEKRGDLYWVVREWEDVRPANFRCAFEDEYGDGCGLKATHVVHVIEPCSYDFNGQPVDDRTRTERYGACKWHVEEMSEVPTGEALRYYNPVLVEIVQPVRPLLDVLAEYMACNCGGYVTGVHLPACPVAPVEPGAGRSALTGEECC